jgi:RecB family endonuclease NucS
MKPATAVRPAMEDNRLVIHSHNTMLRDYMDVIIDKVYFFNSHKLEDGASIVVSGTEADMAEMLYKNPDLVEKGFKPVSMEEQTKYGFIDVFGYDKENILTVVECKRQIADLKAVDQLRRYVEKVRASKGIDRVRGILAAPNISLNGLKMLQDFGFSFVSVKPPRYLERHGKSQTSLNHF